MLPTLAARAERVRIPSAGGVVLNAELVRPSGPAVAPAVVALHGCAGPLPRDRDWADHLAQLGHIVLLPDSFGSRGLGSQCRKPDPGVKASGGRRIDAIASAAWLAAQPGTPPGGVALLGWSNGGNTVLWTARARPDLPHGLFRAFVAFYPGCATVARTETYRPAAPMLVLVGALDDWTPAQPCREFAARFPGLVTLQVYPNAFHDFDAANQPVRLLQGLATPPAGDGRAHAGTEPAARDDALSRVPDFLRAAR